MSINRPPRGVRSTARFGVVALGMMIIGVSCSPPKSVLPSQLPTECWIIAPGYIHSGAATDQPEQEFGHARYRTGGMRDVTGGVAKVDVLWLGFTDGEVAVAREVEAGDTEAGAVASGSVQRPGTSAIHYYAPNGEDHSGLTTFDRVTFVLCHAIDRRSPLAERAIAALKAANENAEGATDAGWEFLDR